MTELVDLYRTISSLAGLPDSSVAADVDGDNVAALLDAPDKILKEEAYSQYGRCLDPDLGLRAEESWSKASPDSANEPDWYFNNCEGVAAENMTSMGYTVRTASWRLTEWYEWDKSRCVAKFGQKALGVELYWHASSSPGEPLNFDQGEDVNLANLPKNAATVTELRAKLRKHFDTGLDLGCPPEPEGDDSLASWELEPHPLGVWKDEEAHALALGHGSPMALKAQRRLHAAPGDKRKQSWPALKRKQSKGGPLQPSSVRWASPSGSGEPNEVSGEPKRRAQ
jgi:hypothetical protein